VIHTNLQVRGRSAAVGHRKVSDVKTDWRLIVSVSSRSVLHSFLRKFDV